MDEFLSGRSFSFVPEAEVQSLVERGPFDPVCLPNELDKVSRLPEHGSHVCFREESEAFAGSLRAFDERPGLRDATLLARLGSSQSSGALARVRGSPKRARTPVSANQVIAEIWSPARVRARRPRARQIGRFGSER
jgi:hypothetical protein